MQRSAPNVTDAVEQHQQAQKKRERLLANLRRVDAALALWDAHDADATGTAPPVSGETLRQMRAMLVEEPGSSD